MLLSPHSSVKVRMTNAQWSRPPLGAPHITARRREMFCEAVTINPITSDPLQPAVSVFMGQAYSLFANSALRQPDDPSKLAPLKRAGVLFTAKLLSSRL